MSQEIKTVFRTITASNSHLIDNEISMMSKAAGWKVFSANYVSVDKRAEGNYVMFILIREVDKDGNPVGLETIVPASTSKRGRVSAAEIAAMNETINETAKA